MENNGHYAHPCFCLFWEVQSYACKACMPEARLWSAQVGLITDSEVGMSPNAAVGGSDRQYLFWHAKVHIAWTDWNGYVYI